MALLGVPQLKKDFRAVSSAISGALRVASYAGAKIVRDKAKAIAPRKTGHGIRYIAAARKRGTKTVGRAEVGFLKPGFYMAILSSGASGHVIKANAITYNRNPETRAKTGGGRVKKRRILAMPAGSYLGYIVFGPEVTVRGIRPRPFLQSALQSSGQQIIEVATQAFNAAIAKKGGA